MANELVRVSPAGGRVATVEVKLPELVERAGGAARFAWEEFFFAEHHNPHTQKAYQSAVRRFLIWCEAEGVELIGITPGMVGQYLGAMSGSPAKRNLHLSTLRGFFDHLVQRHVVLLNPAAPVKGVKEKVVEGETPDIGTQAELYSLTARSDFLQNSASASSPYVAANSASRQ
jgi:integrase/recombinase XerD